MECCETKNKKGCCNDLKKSHLLGNFDEEMKGGERKMNTRVTLWIVIGVLFVIALFLTFKAGAVGSVESVQAAGSAAKSVASSSAGMVGDC